MYWLVHRTSINQSIKSVIQSVGFCQWKKKNSSRTVCCLFVVVTTHLYVRSSTARTSRTAVDHECCFCCCYCCCPYFIVWIRTWYLLPLLVLMPGCCILLCGWVSVVGDARCCCFSFMLLLCLLSEEGSLSYIPGTSLVYVRTCMVLYSYILPVSSSGDVPFDGLDFS